MKKSSRIGRKATIGLAILAVLICLAASASVSMEYRKVSDESYTALAYSYAGAAAAAIDGDMTMYYFFNPTEDAYYWQIQLWLNAFQQNSTIRYYYVIVPLENEMVYIWDTDEDPDTGALGTHETYTPEKKEAVLAALDRTQKQQLVFSEDELYGQTTTAYVPIFDAAGDAVALVGVDFSAPKIRQERIRFTAAIAVSIAAVLLVLNLVFFVFFRKTLVDPITSLNESARSMIRHLEDRDEPELNIRTGDEIEDLGEAFAAMFREVRAYIDRLAAATAEKERMGTELDIAADIQGSMLPRVFPPFPEHDEFEIFAAMDPAREVGGDFYDFFMLDDRHLAIVVADVSGKGVPAALFMVIGKTLIKDHTSARRDLGQVFTEVNNILCASNSEGMFITAFEGVLDLVTGEMVFVNAGHERPFICRAGSSFELQTIRPGFVLAGMEDIRYRGGSFVLEPGDTFFQYTDGVPEATDAASELFGMDRLTQSLDRVKGHTPEEIIRSVKADVDAFQRDAAQFADLTRLCPTYKKRMRDPQN